MIFPSRLLPCAVAACLLAGGVQGESETRPQVRGKNGLVVSADSLASEAGVEILRRGGNAVDAAVAVGFVLAVTYPEAGNLGGGGFMMIRMAGGESTMIDFREKAPSAATRGMYLDPLGEAPAGEKPSRTDCLGGSRYRRRAPDRTRRIRVAPAGRGDPSRP